MRFSATLAIFPAFIAFTGCQAASDSAPRAAGSGSPARAVAASKPAPIAIPAGTVLSLKLQTGLSSASSKEGELIVARLAEDVKLGEKVVLAEGAELRGRVTAAVPSGRVKGRARLAFGFDTLVVDGKQHAIDVREVDITAEPDKGKDAKVIGGGAGAGLIIGALADGKKGAAVGTAIGAATGTGVVLATKGREVELPAGSSLRAHLDKEVRL